MKTLDSGFRRNDGVGVRRNDGLGVPLRKSGKFFKKTRPDDCAFIRTGAEPEFDALKVRAAAENCPVGAIRIIEAQS